ncbi:MAG: DUF4365 domain-containing protein [Chitinophagaceae bacterium]|nr:DUF4365 domain-containing protein [Chitinophagaceae bacterium]
MKHQMNTEPQAGICILLYTVALNVLSEARMQRLRSEGRVSAAFALVRISCKTFSLISVNYCLLWDQELSKAMALTDQNIESELSYAYLHAVASKAGVNCMPSNRHFDNNGTDALLEYCDNIPGTYISDVTLRIQLKATTKPITESGGYLSYFMKEIEQYDKLRTEKGMPHRILVVLFIPNDPSSWLECTHDQLILKKAAYWVNLYGAEESDNKSGVTVYLPKANLLTPDSIINIAQSVAKGELSDYVNPRK